MRRDDTPQVFDIPAALGLLTRLPIRLDASRAAARGAAAAWAWPLAGVAVGAFGATVALVCLGLGLGAGPAAAVAIGTQILLTGALHEDGLADTSDGLWGGHDRARRLEIMKDSRVGSYGVLALLMITLLRWSALAAILSTDSAFAVLVVAGALSRAPMAALMAILPNARGSGLSQSVGRPSAFTVLVGIALAFAIGVGGVGWAILPASLATLAVTIALGSLARAKIGGQTGDILGACQQVSEACILAILAASLA